MLRAYWVPANLWTMCTFCVPPPFMIGHIAQHLAECQVNAVIVVADTQAYWFPLAQRATVQPLQVAPQAAGVFSASARTDQATNGGTPSGQGMHAKKTFVVLANNPSQTGLCRGQIFPLRTGRVACHAVPCVRRGTGATGAANHAPGLMRSVLCSNASKRHCREV